VCEKFYLGGKGGFSKMNYYIPEPVVIGDNEMAIEVTCRYCGERFFFEAKKGEQFGAIVGPKGVKDPGIIGYAHDVCAKKWAKQDDFSFPTKKKSD
jgi:hypothetical protein